MNRGTYRKRKRSKDEDLSVIRTVEENRILEALKCHVCLNYLTPPIRSCKNGHNICNGCWNRLKQTNAHEQCAECRQVDGYTAHNRSLDILMETLSISCYFECGNEYPLSQIDLHCENCDQRPIVCAFGCAKEVNWFDFDKHLMNDHSMIDLGLGDNFNFTQHLEQGTTREPIKQDIFMIREDDDPFFLVQRLYDFGIRITVHSLKKYNTLVTAGITISGTNQNCNATFSIEVKDVREPVRGHNEMIVAAETIIGWCHLIPQQWKIRVVIHIDN